jgi:hypothetical protein
VDNRYYIIGIVSRGECGKWEFLVGADAVRDWVNSIIDRVGVIRYDSNRNVFRVKEGGLSGGWVDHYENVRDAAIAGPRIAVLRNDGHCLVKEGNLNQPNVGWVDEWTAGGVVQCLLTDNRIGILTSDGIFRVKEGGLYQGWVDEYPNVTQAALSGNRIGVLTSDGIFRVKEGSLWENWVDEYANVKQGILAGKRIGVVLTNGDLLVKDGGLYSGWWTVTRSVEQASLSGDRIGVLTGGHFWVRNSSSGWIDEYANVAQGVLSGNRIGVVTYNPAGTGSPESYLVKEGGLSTGWVVEQDANIFGYRAVLPNK